MLTAQESNGGAMPEVKPYAHYPGKMPLTPPEIQRSDDCIWFFNTVPEYVNETGDHDFYNKVLPYSDKGEDTVYEHLKRALQFNLERSGVHGLPCGLHADWDDGFRLGFKGETVMLAFQIRMGWGVFADIATKLGKGEDAKWALAERDKLDANLQKHTWDGKWFIRAFREKGDKLGAAECKEGKIFRPPQSWAVMSGAATPEQAKIALDSVDEHLATEFGLMALMPPYYEANYNEIRAMVLNPGQKENAGIFNHSQGWTVIANCMIGEGDRAYKYYEAFMPSRFNDCAEVRKVEPYVHAQSTDSIYSPNPGTAHLPWLTGSASWAYFTAVQHIIGMRPEKDGLLLDPCIPSDWPSFTASRVFRGKNIYIKVKNPKGNNKGISKLIINGEEVAGNVIPMDKLQAENTVTCEID
jgi:cellobiose phosphorylase